ncbi:MAG: septation protein IspZ [Pseudomonadota bacterium]
MAFNRLQSRVDLPEGKLTIVARYGMSRFSSQAYLGETLVSEDELLFNAGYRNLEHSISPKEADCGLTIEVGYINWWRLGVMVRRGESILYESHPGKNIRFMADSRLMNAIPTQDSAVAAEAAARWERNKYSVYADLGLGALFFVVGKVTGDLTTAALIGAAAGLTLVLLQRYVRVDLLGGFAVFGTIMLLISAGFSLAFQSEFMVQMKSTVLGLLTATLFFGDGLLRGGKYFGERMQRYMPSPIHTGRMAVGLGLLGVFMAGANYLVARFFSEDAWLTYTTFLDMPVSIALAYAVFFWARAGAQQGAFEAEQ